MSCFQDLKCGALASLPAYRSIGPGLNSTLLLYFYYCTFYEKHEKIAAIDYFSFFPSPLVSFLENFPITHCHSLNSAIEYLMFQRDPLRALRCELSLLTFGCVHIDSAEYSDQKDLWPWEIAPPFVGSYLLQILFFNIMICKNNS